jgi:dynein heavy chain
VKPENKSISRTDIPFMHDSFFEYVKPILLTDVNFLKKLIFFSENEKDNINDETCELLEPYLRLE